MSKVFSLRLADGLAARVEEIAAARSVKPAVLLRGAVESLIDDYDRGLPDAPREVRDAPAVEARAERPAVDIDAIRAKAAAAAARANAERERRHAERGW